jgi:hypothetical protein
MTGNQAEEGVATMTWPKRFVLAFSVLLCVSVVSTGAALATNLVEYSGNVRYPGYGCKALIWTPATFQSIQKGLAFN